MTVRFLIFQIDRLIYKGFKNPLTFDDLWKTNPRDECERIVGSMETNWKRESDKNGWTPNR